MTWRIAAPRAAETGDQVRLTLDIWSPRNAGTTAAPVSFATLRGLPKDQLNRTDHTPARFEMVRDAGRLDCTGSVGGGRGSGDCRFTPDQAFTAALERRGMRRPETREQLELALQDVSLAFLAELDRQGYPAPTVPQLLAAGVHRVTVSYLQSLDAAGYRAGSIDKLVALRIFKIDADRIRALAAVGPRFRDLAPDTLIAMSIHGVTPEFATRTIAAGRPDLTPDELIRLRILGPRAFDLSPPAQNRG